MTYDHMMVRQRWALTAQQDLDLTIQHSVHLVQSVACYLSGHCDMGE